MNHTLTLLAKWHYYFFSYIPYHMFYMNCNGNISCMFYSDIV